MAIFKGRVRVRYGYSRWGYTRNNGKGWHGGSDEEGLDSTTIRMPDYKGKSISGRVVTARQGGQVHGQQNVGMGLVRVCGAGRGPDAGRGELPVFLPQRAESGYPWASGWKAATRWR